MSERATSHRITLVLLFTASALLAPRSAHAQDWRTISQTRQLAGESSLDVDARYAAGELRVGPATGGTLYRLGMRYNADVFEPRITFADSRLRVGMEDATIRGRTIRGGRLDLRLSPDVPIDLDLEFGAAEAHIELGGLRITSAGIKTGASRTRLAVATPNPVSCRRLTLEVGAAEFEAVGLANLNAQQISLNGGVGELTLDFSGDWRQDLAGTIEMGLGTLTLRVPRGLGVRINKGGLLSSFDSQGLVKKGDVYYSEDWGSTEHELSLDIKAALGSIRVVWIE